MLKNEEQAIDIIAFLITSYRKAVNHQGDPEPIEKANKAYCDSLEIYCGMTEKDVHILYLKGKIKADKEQLQRHQVEVAKLMN